METGVNRAAVTLVSVFEQTLQDIIRLVSCSRLKCDSKLSKIVRQGSCTHIETRIDPQKNATEVILCDGDTGTVKAEIFFFDELFHLVEKSFECFNSCSLSVLFRLVRNERRRDHFGSYRSPALHSFAQRRRYRDALLLRPPKQISRSHFVFIDFAVFEESFCIWIDNFQRPIWTDTSLSHPPQIKDAVIPIMGLRSTAAQEVKSLPQCPEITSGPCFAMCTELRSKGSA